MNGKVNHQKENSMNNSVYTLRETSTLYPNFHPTDILISLTIETWLSRHQMEEALKHGTSIKHLWLSELSWITNLGTSKAQENPTTSKSGVQIPNGGKCLLGTVSLKTSVTSKKLADVLMLVEVKMKKQEQFKFGKEMVQLPRNGQLNILIKKRKNQPREWMKTSVSISIDHSSSYQECQWRELSKWLELPTLSLRNTLREEKPRHSFSTVLKRLSKATTGKTIVLKSLEMEEAKTLELEQTVHQDGGNSGESKVPTLSTRKERSLM